MIYDPARRAQELRHRIIERMTAEEVEEYNRQTLRPGKFVRVLFGTKRSLAVATTVDRILVQAADQAGNLSPPTEWRR